MDTSFDSVLAAVKAMSPAERAAMSRDAWHLSGGAIWVPNPGPQTWAYFSEADELLYGGTAGCGKTGLLVGLSLTKHTRSLFLRRTNKEAARIFDAYYDILGTREGYNGQDDLWRIPESVVPGGRMIEMAGCQMEDDKQKQKGTPRDLYCFDELCDFTETQYTFIKTWNRSSDPNQRCRVVATSNPPTTPEGQWLIRYWAPWLDPRHPRPAKPGELRWFIGGKEVDGPGPHWVDGKPTRALSRTFIPGKLADNPDLAQSNYDSVLASLPEELRLAYREGQFNVGLKDSDFQLIKTEWVRAAFDRWSPAVPYDTPMSCMSVDIAQGGEDDTVIAYRYGPYYCRPVRKKGKETPDGASIAGLVIAHRRDQCEVVVDMTGGYGGDAYSTLKNNGVEALAFKGNAESRAKTRDGQFGFLNRRTEVYFKFAEALNPDQPGGSQIALPESQELLLDLCTPRWNVVPGRSGLMQITPKVDVVAALGRSPDEGDAVVTCWSTGAKAYNPPVDANLAEHGLVRRQSTVVDLGTRRAVSIVGQRRRT
ncbi:MAG: terminase [Reyranella sp.]|uniref:terminase n=1 Tax=Reyranella sp. TaxID=1929291 RepID=UPI003D11D66C